MINANTSKQERTCPLTEKKCDKLRNVFSGTHTNEVCLLVPYNVIGVSAMAKCPKRYEALHPMKIEDKYWIRKEREVFEHWKNNGREPQRGRLITELRKCCDKYAICISLYGIQIRRKEKEKEILETYVQHLKSMYYKPL